MKVFEIGVELMLKWREPWCTNIMLVEVVESNETLLVVKVKQCTGMSRWGNLYISAELVADGTVVIYLKEN